MSAPDIEVSGVSFAYNGNTVLEDISFTVNTGDFLGIIGPNGSGKTTLLKLLLGMLQPAAGTIRIFGGNPGKVSRLFGYVPQETTLNRDFPISVKDVALMGRLGAVRRLRHYAKKDHEIIRRNLEQVGMWRHRSRRIGDLSMGQRQRVFIARALSVDPRILILDEPTASIDPAGQALIYDILKTLNERMTVLVVSHDLNILLGYVNKVACVNKRLYFHDAPHVTTEMLNNTFGFSLEQICPLEPLPDKKETPSNHNGEGSPDV